MDGQAAGNSEVIDGPDPMAPQRTESMNAETINKLISEESIFAGRDKLAESCAQHFDKLAEAVKATDFGIAISEQAKKAFRRREEYAKATSRAASLSMRPARELQSLRSLSVASSPPMTLPVARRDADKIRRLAGQIAVLEAELQDEMNKPA